MRTLFLLNTLKETILSGKRRASMDIHQHFLLFRLRDQLSKFHQYFNQRHPNKTRLNRRRTRNCHC